MSNRPILSVTPAKELVFRGTNFDHSQTEKLTLENISNQNIGFKVKTTALKAYLVRPSSQVLKPGEKIDVMIMLQRLPEVPANHQHRFLVQAVNTTLASIDNRDAWNQMATQSGVQEFRLSVVFPDVNGDGSANGAPQTSPYASQNRDLQSKYQELSDYTKALQDRREELKREIKKLENEGGGAKKGFGFLSLIIAVVLAILMHRVMIMYKVVPGM